MKTFEKIYDELYNKHYSKLSKLQLFYSISKIIFIISIIILIVDFIIMIGPGRSKFFIIIFIIVLLIFIISFICYKSSINNKNTKNNYINYYKNNIIKSIIEYVFEKNEYSFDSDILRKEYIMCNWENIDYYKSNNMISTIINNYKLKFADTYTSMLIVNNNIHTTRNEFSGLFGYVELDKEYNGSIKILDNKKSKKNLYDFENIFITKDNIDFKLKNILIELYKKYKNPIDIFLQDKRLYFRIHCFEPYEVSLIGNPLKYNKLENVYNILNNINELLVNILNYLENNDIILSDKESNDFIEWDSNKSYISNLKDIYNKEKDKLVKDKINSDVKKKNK